MSDFPLRLNYRQRQPACGTVGGRLTAADLHPQFLLITPLNQAGSCRQPADTWPLCRWQKISSQRIGSP